LRAATAPRRRPTLPATIDAIQQTAQQADSERQQPMQKQGKRGGNVEVAVCGGRVEGAEWEFWRSRMADVGRVCVVVGCCRWDWDMSLYDV
jgi:hypothetical protein